MKSTFFIFLLLCLNFANANELSVCEEFFEVTQDSSYSDESIKLTLLRTGRYHEVYPVKNDNSIQVFKQFILPSFTSHSPFIIIGKVGAGNSGKSTLQEHFLNILDYTDGPLEISKTGTEAGMTKRPVILMSDVHEDIIDTNIKERINSQPTLWQSPEDSTKSGNAIVYMNSNVPSEIISIDAPDFDTKTANNLESSMDVLRTAEVIIYLFNPNNYKNFSNLEHIGNSLADIGERKIILMDRVPDYILMPERIYDLPDDKRLEVDGRINELKTMYEEQFDFVREQLHTRFGISKEAIVGEYYMLESQGVMLRTKEVEIEARGNSPAFKELINGFIEDPMAIKKEVFGSALRKNLALLEAEALMHKKRVEELARANKLLARDLEKYVFQSFGEIPRDILDSKIQESWRNSKNKISMYLGLIKHYLSWSALKILFKFSKKKFDKIFVDTQKMEDFIEKNKLTISGRLENLDTFLIKKVSGYENISEETKVILKDSISTWKESTLSDVEERVESILSGLMPEPLEEELTYLFREKTESTWKDKMMSVWHNFAVVGLPMVTFTYSLWDGNVSLFTEGIAMFGSLMASESLNKKFEQKEAKIYDPIVDEWYREMQHDLVVDGRISELEEIQAFKAGKLPTLEEIEQQLLDIESLKKEFNIH
ncbi:MAG: hypothetical protein H6622_05910 [Halobacteriovoraceae bacterium]|nr:hypothetical protein [Halobacteriovoraceae bacterium]